MDMPAAWLLAGEAFVVLRTHLDLLGQAESDLDDAIRPAMVADTRVQTLLAELANWPGQVIASHKSASQPFHKLTFLADLGLRADDPGMEAIIARIRAHPSPEGPFCLPMNIPTHYGGSGQDQWAWALCDAPLILYALLCFGLEETVEVRRAMAHLIGLVRDNGWPCALSAGIGFRGPGRKDDPCPFANLAMLKALAASKAWCDSPAVHAGVETLLSLWRDSRERHPYQFHMGTDFRKLKAPFVWYDLLHVLDVLSRFAWVRTDERLLDMLGVLVSKVDSEGRFTPESVWTAWKGWEFAQKREPSRWLTLLAWRILRRIKGAAYG
jgi:hypothetical protein